MQWYHYPVEPISSFQDEFQRLSGCEVKVKNTWGYETEDLLPVLRGVDIVFWWKWNYDVGQIEKARKNFPNALFILQNWDDPYAIFFSGTIQPYKGLYEIVFSSSTSALPTYLNVSFIQTSSRYSPRFQFI